MNDQQILELIARTPDIRAVQIADKFDRELSDVSDALRSLVDVGDVVRHAGTAPNGQPAQMYNLSAEFQKSREGVALLQRAELLVTDTVHTPTAAAVLAPSAFPLEVPSLMSQPIASGTRVERAIAFVIAHKVVSDDDLRVAMGLVRPAAPAGYLKAAQAAGKLFKEGGFWKPGRAPDLSTQNPPVATAIAPTPERRQKCQGIEARLPVATTQSSSAPASCPVLPPEEIAAIGTLTLAEIAPTITPVYRCALWSDDILEIRRDGLTLAEIPKSAGESLAAFLLRVMQGSPV